MEIKTYRVKQYSSKPTTIICVDGEPVVSVRGRKSVSDIISYLSGYQVELKDKAIERKLNNYVN